MTVSIAAPDHWSIPRFVFRNAAAAAAAAGVLMGLAGCTLVRDSIASLIGAPTSEQIAAEERRLDEAERKVDDLNDQIGIANTQIAAAEAEAAKALVRKEDTKGVFGAMAQQLTTLEGAAADAMITAMASLQEQMRLAGEQSQDWQTIAAGYVAKVAEIEGAANKQRRIIADARANLEGFVDATEAAIAGVGSFVTLAGETATALGVPGAKAATDTATNWLNGAMYLLLGSGTVGGGMMARRRRRQGEANTTRAEGERDDEARKAGDLTRIVTAVEKFGLLKDDKDLRTAAKEWAGTGPHKTLNVVLAENGA